MRRREVIKVNDAGDIAVVDVVTDMFGKKHFHAGLITTEMRPVTVCRNLGSFTTRKEAATAASGAMTPAQCNSPSTGD